MYKVSPFLLHSVNPGTGEFLVNQANILVSFTKKGPLFPDYEYIEDYTSVWIITQRHNCDVRKDSDQSKHTISTIS